MTDVLKASRGIAVKSRNHIGGMIVVHNPTAIEGREYDGRSQAPVPMFWPADNGAVRPRQVVSESFRRIYSLVHRYKSAAGLFPPLGVLIVQPADHLVRLAGIDADHDLVIGLGGLAGEDVENGPAVRRVHTSA